MKVPTPEDPLRVVELFSGIGAQATALKMAGIPYKVVGTSEIDKHAMASYEAIHGPVVQLGDIRDIEHLPECDLLTYSFPCLTGDVKVLSSKGWVCIRDLEVGDCVYSHDGGYHRIIAAGCTGTKPTLTIRIEGMSDIRCTENHLFRRRNKDGLWVWAEAGRLRQGDMLRTITCDSEDGKPVYGSVIVLACISNNYEEKVYDKKSLVIGISQGGQSLSTVEGLDAATERGLLTAAVSENPTALVFEHAQTKTLLEVGNEKCGAKTKGYAGSIMTLMLMVSELALAKGITDQATVDGYLERMRTVIANLPAVTDAAVDWYGHIADDLLPARRVIVVGYDGMYGDVLEGALKTLETLRVGIAGYDIEEFFHGIYNSISEDSYLFYLASAGDYKPRTLRLIEILGEWTSHNYLIASPAGVETPTSFDCIVPFTEDPLFSCFEFIIPMQVVACFGAEARGIDPSIPKDPLFHERIGSKKLDGVRDNYVRQD